MATILIHAGTPKSGSTAIQDYLRRHQELLASRGVMIAVASRPGDGPQPVVVREYDGGTITSGQLVRLILEQPESKPEVMRALTRGLDQLARRSNLVVLTAEGLAQPIWRADPEFLRPLDQLASSHTVRVAYYVRPQHSAMEARWRQWGFRMGRSPAAFIKSRVPQVRYFETLQSVSTTAPGLDFVVRPFREDLLDRGDVVVDFAKHFLGFDTTEVDSFDDHRANVGMPLEIINLLSCAPPGLLGPTPHDNADFERVKALLRNIGAPSSAAVQHGRELLQAWCHEQFESSNRELVDRLDWATDHFIPATDEPTTDLRPLDTLWRPMASAQEIEAFLTLLEHYLSTRADA